MREHRFHQLVLGGFCLHGDGVALDELGHFGADHVRAEKFAGLGVEHDFDHALIFAERDRLAVADERKAADAHFPARGFRLRLGEADAGDLRMRIGAARNALLDHRMRFLPGDCFDANDALVRRLVRQPRRAGDISDCVEPGDIGFAVAIGDDVAAISFDVQCFETEILDVAGDANSDDGV